eukprot:27632_1
MYRITMTSFLWLNLLPLIHAFEINDFQIGIQLCDINAGENVGQILYTPFFRNGGGWTDWASNREYSDPDGMRIGLFGRHNSAITLKTFHLRNTDIRFCIQLTDDTSHEYGNANYKGAIRCSPWASEGGGWSDWAGDINFHNFDAVRVKLDIISWPGLLITDIQTGIRVTNNGTNPIQMGYIEYTQWLIGTKTVTSTWSEWAGDINFRNPDAIKIFLGIQMNYRTKRSTRVRTITVSAGSTDSVEGQNKFEEQNILKLQDNNEDNFSITIKVVKIFSLCVGGLMIIICIIVIVYRFRKIKKNDHIIRIPTNEDDIEELDVEID